MSTFLVNLGMWTFKRYALPLIRENMHVTVDKMADDIVTSEKNPVTIDTVIDIRRHADKALSDMFDEWE